MNIVAVAALDQAFFDPVMKGLAEGGLHIRVAGKAKFRLRVASPMCIVVNRETVLARWLTFGSAACRTGSN